MFGLTFLANEKKKALEKLEKHLTTALSPFDRNETNLLIQEITAQAKPYQQCELAEAEELKIQLLNKIGILTGIGKLASVEVFRMHLMDVDFHIQTKQMEEKLIESKKIPQPDDPSRAPEEGKTPTLGSMYRERKKKAAFGSPRWLIGFEDEPDITQPLPTPATTKTVAKKKPVTKKKPATKKAP